MSKTFVKEGQRVTVYTDPYSMRDIEGTGTVLEVSKLSDLESAYVKVWFDDEPCGVWRWVLPAHIVRKVGQ